MKRVNGQSKQENNHDYTSKSFPQTVLRCRLVSGMHIPVHRNSKGHNNLLGHSNPHYCHNYWHSLFSYRMERGIIMSEKMIDGMPLSEYIKESEAEPKEYTQDLGSLIVDEQDVKEIEEDWYAWILKQAKGGYIEADGLFDKDGERV